MTLMTSVGHSHYDVLWECVSFFWYLFNHPPTKALGNVVHPIDKMSFVCGSPIIKGLALVMREMRQKGTSNA